MPLLYKAASHPSKWHEKTREEKIYYLKFPRALLKFFYLLVYMQIDCNQNFVTASEFSIYNFRKKEDKHSDDDSLVHINSINGKS